MVLNVAGSNPVARPILTNPPVSHLPGIFLAVFPNKYEDSLGKQDKTLEFAVLRILTRPDDSPDDSPLDAGCLCL